MGTTLKKLLDMVRISRLSEALNICSGRPASVSLLLWRYTDLGTTTMRHVLTE